MSEGRPRPALFQLPLDDATPPLEAEPRKATIALDAPPPAAEVSNETTGGAEVSAADDPPEIVESTEEDLRGTMVGGYKIEHKIGGGGFADVYQGRHQYLPRLAAVKVLRRVLTASTAARRRFTREAEVLGALDHPHVVKLVDFGVLASGRPFLITELVEGETLRLRLDSAVRVSPEDAWAWTRQLALGIQAMHARGVVHRDLKPTNVMLSEVDRRVRILDLGIARWMEPGERTRLTAVGRMLGTPMYAAPEQLVDAANAGPPADLYAVGAMLYEMCTGRTPFPGDRQEVMRAKMAGAPALSPNASGLEQIAIELLDPVPSQRLATAELLLDKLENARPQPATVMLANPAVVQPAGKRSQASIAPLTQAIPPITQNIATPVAPASNKALWLIAGVAVAVAFTVGLMAGVAGRDDPAVMAPVQLEPQPTAEPLPPGAKAAAMIEPAPDPTAAAAATPLASPRSTPRPKPSTKPLDEQKLVKDVERALSKRGLLPADIDLTVDTTAWRAALSSGDAAKAEGATRALIHAIEEAQIQEPVVSARIRRLLSAARETSERRSQNATQAIEDRCFELRRTLRSAGPTERAEILREIVALERRLNP